MPTITEILNQIPTGECTRLSAEGDEFPTVSQIQHCASLLFYWSRYRERFRAAVHPARRAASPLQGVDPCDRSQAIPSWI